MQSPDMGLGSDGDVPSVAEPVNNPRLPFFVGPPPTDFGYLLYPSAFRVSGHLDRNHTAIG
jgi:hypothetical protein